MWKETQVLVFAIQPWIKEKQEEEEADCPCAL